MWTQKKTIATDLAIKFPEKLLDIPNRVNLRLPINKVPRKGRLIQQEWLVDMIRMYGKENPKTITFVKPFNRL